MDCIFCKIVSGDLPSKKQYEDDEVLAFDDAHPQAPVHVLIIPKKHIARLVDTTQKDQSVLGKCQLVAVEIAKKLGIDESFRLTLANGERAGQEVFHLHYHVMGRR